MSSNHEKYGIQITLENLKCSVQVYRGFTCFAEKVTKELEVIKLAFSIPQHNIAGLISGITFIVLFQLGEASTVE